MKSRIWRMAGVGVMCVSVSTPLLAGNQGPTQQPQPNQQGSDQPSPSSNLPIQGRPDAVRQTQEPRPGYYQDIPRRPAGHGNGWGPGPHYRPGHETDRFPDRNYRVPYRGQDYFYSGGYWYRPQGQRYVVVRPPYGIRVSDLPDYAREVWIGGALFFLATGVYYSYEAHTGEYVVVQPPAGYPEPPPPSLGNGYDVVAYPANGQSRQQVDQDGYDCYRWAVEQSGFDPRAMTYQPAPQVVQRYRQAQGDCLGSRGYRVE
ncbi:MULTISPECIES: DUF6515 family protein [unclassified Pseudomonas]|uniref:DUF6515 family protein n=1 Tax=unclassified Pseudomonas TaxID=196821 RepID=UPI000BA315FD|nr:MULTISPECIES: DUF6515 family protein [unclassified Pseudomonas]